MKSSVLAMIAAGGIVPAAILAQSSNAGTDWSARFGANGMRSQPAAAGSIQPQSAFASLRQLVTGAQASASTPAPQGTQPTPAPATDHAHHVDNTRAATALRPTVQDGVAQLAKVASGLPLKPLLYTGSKIASSGKPDVVGAFRFLCQPSHLGYWDPVVFPGDRTGKSHLHQFFGNTKTNADSTYESLRKTGDSTCMNTANRSGYWQPAMIQTKAGGQDEVVVPEYINIYYKRRPASDPHYSRRDVSPVNYPVNIPRGLRYIFGYPTSPPKFKCIDPKNWSNVTDWSSNMGEVLAKCPVGGQLDAEVHSPACWDGKNLDSRDHRSHMAYPIRNQSTGYQQRCPASHPYEIPTFTLQAMYEVLPTDRVKTWRFSSDAMMTPGKPAGSSFHADWFGAWEDSVLETWQEWCINKLLNCSSGDLGNGSGLTESKLYQELKKKKGQRVPLPSV
ncbi:DUF1996 domain-containing protein [Porphyrobacter sp. GA68]|uniref:DUF1996 domain-containing protein n=1 Tax=Porphyrobacter sp. GA68 TaxID=2883480 RepID=UPI001D18790B|nr:DUF1996 domain-containing protein [Porphyrobacter sp. GA68]